MRKTDNKNVWELNYKGFPKGLRFYPSILQKYFIKRKFKLLERLCQTEFDVIWSFDNSGFYDFTALPKKILKISHIVDLNQHFQLAKAAKTADICFGVSAAILNRLEVHNDKSFFINHGCNNYKGERIASLPGENKIKATYAGNLNISYINWCLFRQLVSENKEVDFILIGPWSEGKRKSEVKSFSNVFYVGELNAGELSDYYAVTDILLVIYKADEYPEQLSNPHKMMEYFAAGKMIVASQTTEYEQLVKEGLFLMCEETQEFAQLFESAVKNLSYWNSDKLKNARQKFALDNTYDKQLDRIELALTESL